MKAVVYAGPHQVRIEDVARPQIQDDLDAVVRVEKSSICASDIHLLSGKTPGMPTGAVIGHEFVGTVTETGHGVSGHKESARVVGSFLIACGDCIQCRSSRFNYCLHRRALGLGPVTGNLGGAQAEYVRVPRADVNLHALSGPFDELSSEACLFAGDILTTGFYAASLAEIERGQTVVVVGAGPVGLCTTLALRLRDPAQVLVLDADPGRVAFVRRLGLDGIDVSIQDADTAVGDRTDGRMADVAIEAVGAPAAFKTAMRCARDGGRVVVVGVYGSERYELPMGMTWVRGLDLRFSGMANIHAHWNEALSAVLEGKVDPSQLITHRLLLDDAEEGYELFRTREAMKVVLNP